MAKILKYSGLFLILLLHGTKSFALDFKIDPTLSFYLGGGVILGQGDEINKVDRVSAGARISTFEYSFKNKNKVSILSTGVSVRSDLLVSFSVAPTSIIVGDKFMFGVDYYLPTKVVNPGTFGIFVGIPL